MQQYFTDRPIKLNQPITLSSEQVHHIAHVMRMTKDDDILISDETGIYYCSLKFLSNQVLAVPYKIYEHNSEHPFQINLYMALIKNDKWELVLQKASELGVTKVIPVITSRTVVKLNDNHPKKLERWRKIAQEACEQAHRTKKVIITDSIKLTEVCYEKDLLNIIAYENEEANHIGTIKIDKDVNLIIGPEGGFSDNEIKRLVKMGYQTYSLGKRILRAETAVFYALSIIGLGGDMIVWKK